MVFVVGGLCGRPMKFKTTSDKTKTIVKSKTTGTNLEMATVVFFLQAKYFYSFDTNWILIMFFLWILFVDTGY